MSIKEKIVWLLISLALGVLLKDVVLFLFENLYGIIIIVVAITPFISSLLSVAKKPREEKEVVPTVKAPVLSFEDIVSKRQLYVANLISNKFQNCTWQYTHDAYINELFSGTAYVTLTDEKNKGTEIEIMFTATYAFINKITKSVHSIRNNNIADRLDEVKAMVKTLFLTNEFELLDLDAGRKLLNSENIIIRVNKHKAECIIADGHISDIILLDEVVEEVEMPTIAIADNDNIVEEVEFTEIDNTDYDMSDIDINVIRQYLADNNIDLTETFVLPKSLFGNMNLRQVAEELHENYHFDFANANDKGIECKVEIN